MRPSSYSITTRPQIATNPLSSSLLMQRETSSFLLLITIQKCQKRYPFCILTGRAIFLLKPGTRSLSALWTPPFTRGDNFLYFHVPILTAASSVSISIASIASIIPSGEDNTALYYGLQNAKVLADNTPSKTFYEASQSLQRETAIQLADAHNRNVVWDADSDAANALNGDDAEGEPDPLYPQLQDHAGLREPRPLAIRQPDGSLQPCSPPAAKHTMNIIKSRRQDERSVNFDSQTSSKLVCFMRRFHCSCLITSPLGHSTAFGGNSDSNVQHSSVNTTNSFKLSTFSCSGLHSSSYSW